MQNNNSVVKMTPKFSAWIIEEEILSALVQNRQKMTTFIDEIDAEFFNSSDCKNIFKMTKMYWEKYSSSPKKNIIVSSVQKLFAAQNGKPISPTIFTTIDKIFDRDLLTDDELQYYHDELLKFIKSGKIKDIIFEGINKIDDPNAFDEIQEKLKDAVLWRIDENLGIDITNVKERYSRQKELLDSYIPTPWGSVNNLIGGGFFAKTLSCFVAGSSVGKSIALDQIAFDAWANQKKNVVLITLELSEEMKGMRIDSHFMNRFIGELPSKEKEVEEAYSRIQSDGKRFIIKEFPTSSIVVRKVSHFISRLEMYSGFKPELIVVDYADLLLPNSGKREGLYADGAAIFEALRGISYEYNCPVVTATQFNRNAGEKPPAEINEFDISESHKKIMTLDTCVAIIATPGMRSQGQSAFKVLKARMGQKDSIIPMNVSYEFFKFFE